MGGRQRLQFLTDKDSFQELFAQVEGDPLDFPGYQEKLETVRKVSSEREAVLCGTARIGGQPCCLFIMEPRFMMGSMGTAVGERSPASLNTPRNMGCPWWATPSPAGPGCRRGSSP